MGKIIAYINLPRQICTHLLGEHHAPKHRMIVGFFVMGTGVWVAKCAHHIPVEVLAGFVDMVGYGIHALGATPYIESAIKVFAEGD